MNMSDDALTKHPTATLLPWYLSGTLKESERRAVDEHLETCADCRQELDNLTKLRAPLKAAFADQPMPALDVSRAVIAQIHAERADHQEPEGSRSGVGFGEAVEQWFRNLFAPRWVPMLAATLLIGQLGLLLWTAGEQTPLPPRAVITRNVPPVQIPSRVALAFKDSVSEARIRAAILGLKGRLVDGPTTDGVYTIEVPASEAGTLDARLQTLRQQTTVIRRAERLAR
jgi:anti-sigma factor RsiW